ncbi:ABC transporter substrate-binding protein [Nitrosococcus wardiae]|uniref:ABC transporter substrate-binding protein n=2 Tax=Nitrosococcus wardiae TaxID=1814290 RepID=A0A4V1AWG8_9GAMM|nr:ABC transporter substrate-binding protein [Nitrosococcus wardiae]
MGLLSLVSLAVLSILVWLWYAPSENQPVIQVGVLHSLSGTMAVSEKPLVNALQLAIEEANATGGINGQKIKAVAVDCRSDPIECAYQAERLITQEEVQALFGCWTSACRKAVKPVVEKYQHLLFYPVQYEGMEQSPNIIYTGAAPNQQIIPAVIWALEKLGTRIYLVGSDYVFPRMANIIIKDLLVAKDAVLVGERYVPLGKSAADELIADIIKQRPDVVLNTLNGDSNISFFRSLAKAGITPDKIPVLSFSIAEVELKAQDTQMMVGHFAAWNYFQSIKSAQNQAFVQRFHARFGQQTVLSDPMEASYIGLHLWVQAAREASSAEPASVQHTILRQSLLAPEGVVSVDRATRHLWKMARIGKARDNGQFEILWDSGRPLEPAPFPSYRRRDEWMQLLQSVEGVSP